MNAIRSNKKVRGFTLVEIMIVVTIIGILSSLAVPAFQRARWKALETSIRNNLRQIWGAAQQYMLENGVDTVDTSTIVAWKSKKDDTVSGTDAGYTSVIQQVSEEDYNQIMAYTSDNITSFTTDETEDPGITGGTNLTADTQAMVVAVGTGGKARYVKLRL